MLRVGVIGCGGMGRDHIRRLTEKIQGAEVVAVSDVFEESARKAAEICGAKVYADSKELINAENVDAVFIVSPGFAHVDSLLQAIEAGKRIFCEKPLCTTAEDCLKVVKAEEAAGKHLIQLGFMLDSMDAGAICYIVINAHREWIGLLENHTDLFTKKCSIYIFSIYIFVI